MMRDDQGQWRNRRGAQCWAGQGEVITFLRLPSSETIIASKGKASLPSLFLNVSGPSKHIRLVRKWKQGEKEGQWDEGKRSRRGRKRKKVKNGKDVGKNNKQTKTVTAVRCIEHICGAMYSM